MNVKINSIGIYWTATYGSSSFFIILICERVANLLTDSIGLNIIICDCVANCREVNTMSARVYIFAGFLESGKTTALQGLLNRSREVLSQGYKSIIICTEEGEEEYEEEILKATNTTIVNVDDEDDFDFDFMQKLEEEYEPDIVYIEFNGMWDLKRFVEEPMPMGWILLNVFTLVDATTFPIYLENMRQIMMNPISVSDVVLFNRCMAGTKKGEIRRPIKILNPSAQVYFSMMDGSVDDGMEDFLMPQEDGIIHIEEDIFCSFFVDCVENPDKYYGQKIIMKAMVSTGDGLQQNQFYAGRLAAICCQADAQFIGFIAETNDIIPVEKDWIEMEATVEKGQLSEGRQIILLKTNTINQIEEPEDIYVYA